MTANRRCFVIQPFTESYNARFNDIYKPAIEAASLVAYRVDEDKGVNIITETIEYGIRNAHICFADISENNPNVWYELGFAYACEKPVVLVCNEDVRGAEILPFDIKVKNVTFYSNIVNSDRHATKGLMHEISDCVKAKSEKTDSIPNIKEITCISKCYVTMANRADECGNETLAIKYRGQAKKISDIIDKIHKLKDKHNNHIINAEHANKCGNKTLAIKCQNQAKEEMKRISYFLKQIG